MNQKEKLLYRLEQIGKALKESGKARALIGFGSVGVETERIDDYSDLDFLAVVKKGVKSEFINNMSWLSSVAKISYCHMNTNDGFKIFFEDGIYCEFGVLEEDEVNQIPHAEGRLIWSEQDFNTELRMPTKKCDYEVNDINWAFGEALTNLYVGLCRFARGEKLSATRFIQMYAVDHLLACSHLLSKEVPYYKDSFQNERRYEIRYTSIASCLPDMIQGYEKCPESALAILEFIEREYTVTPFFRKIILNLIDHCIQSRE